MSTVTVARITEDEARARRDAILEKVRDVDAFRARARAYLLDVHEQALLDELDDLDYLLAL
jgi:hypothetical protein